jgi:sphingolipid 4-desaturase/C4-monooxygenase
MGDPVHDTDLPTAWEIKTFNRPWKKLIFVFLHPVFYMIRPFVMAPKPISFLELLNLLVIGTSNYCIYRFIGPYALLYLALAGYMSMGLHPMAMHTIAEHYEFVKG